MYQLLTSTSTFGMFFQVLPITLLVGILYSVCRWHWLKKQDASVAWGKEVVRLLFVCYLTGLVNLILVPANFWTYIWFFLRNGYRGGELAPLFSGEFNLVPTIVELIAGRTMIGSWVLEMLIGNFLMFIPMGVFLPFIFEKVNRQNILVISIAIPVVVEIIQPIVGRSFDIDDLILNFAGIIVGYMIATQIKSFMKAAD